MKLIVLKENFKEGISIVERAAGDNTNLPVLKTALIKTEKSKLRFSATNLEIGSTHFINAKIIEEGGVAVPIATLSNIVSNIDSERISIETNNQTIIIKTDNYQAKIQGMHEEEFPIIPTIEEQKHHTQTQTLTLTEAISAIINAAQISEIRPELSGILFDFQNSTLKLAATDSFRLAEKTIANTLFKTTHQKTFRSIIPLKTCLEIGRMFKNNETIFIYTDPSQILFKTQNTELISRLIDGNYPDYEQIIPKNTETEIILDREQFINALKLVGSITGKINDVKINTKSGDKTMEIQALNQYVGENSYLIPAKIKGKGFSGIGFNWRYLIDGLKAINSKNILFQATSDAKPALIKSTEDETYFYILMPIKAS